MHNQLTDFLSTISNIFPGIGWIVLVVLLNWYITKLLDAIYIRDSSKYSELITINLNDEEP